MNNNQTKHRKRSKLSFLRFLGILLFKFSDLLELAYSGHLSVKKKNENENFCEKKRMMNFFVENFSNIFFYKTV